MFAIPDSPARPILSSISIAINSPILWLRGLTSHHFAVAVRSNLRAAIS